MNHKHITWQDRTIIVPVMTQHPWVNSSVWSTNSRLTLKIKGPLKKYTHTYLLNVAVKAEEVKDAGAVHLRWMEATHHGNRTRGVARVWGGWLGQRVGHHVWNIHWGELIPAVTRQRQQWARWTWRGRESRSWDFQHSSIKFNEIYVMKTILPVSVVIVRCGCLIFRKVSSISKKSFLPGTPIIT